MNREKIERQLKMAQQQLAAFEKTLSADKANTTQAKNAKWRHLEADLRSLKRRLLAVKGVEEREAAAQQRRAEKAAGVTAGAE